MSKTELYRCTLECKIKGIPNRVEYLRTNNDDELISMFERCENLEGSEYYGYKWVEIKSMNLKDFPKIKTVEVNVK